MTATVCSMPTPRTHATIPTALHDDGSIDEDGQRRVAASVAAAGVTGIIALDLAAGEGGLLDDDERDAVHRTTRQGAGGVPVVVGIGAPDTGMVARAHRTAAAGADGLLAALPASAERRLDLLGEVAATGLPLWLHLLPGPTGEAVSTTELAAIADELGAAGILVDAAPSPDVIAGLVTAETAPGFGGLGGLFLLEELEAGAAGTTAGGAVPEGVAELIARASTDPAGARERFLELLPYLRLEAGSPGVRVRKEAWRQRGELGSGRARRGEALGATMKRAVTRRLREVGAPVRNPYPGS